MIVCVGHATWDTILVVPRHPQPDDRIVATSRTTAGGGPAATAAVALARLGVEVAFIGAVGDDLAGHEIRTDLVREGVDVSELEIVPGRRSPESVILAGDATRAIVTSHQPTLQLSASAVALCRAADWVHVDHVGYPAAPSGVRLSVDAGTPISGLDLARVALYAPTEDSDTGERAELTVVTRGLAGCTAYVGDETIEVPGFRVGVVGTLGEDDVFHGALLAGLVGGLPLRDCLVRATACVALSCRALDGRSAIPTADELDRILA